MIVENTSGAFGKSRASGRAHSSDAERRDHGTLRLPAYGDLELGYSRSDRFGCSVIWVRDANVYMHLGSPSLNFVFHDGSGVRRTSRITTCKKLKLADGKGEIRCYLGAFDVEQAGVNTTLSIWIADNPVIQAPLILCSQDMLRIEGRLVEKGRGILR